MLKYKINPFFVLILGALAIAFSPIFVRFSDVDPIMTAFYRIFLSLPFFLFFSSFGIIEKIKFPEVKNYYLVFFFSGLFFALDLICWHWSIKLTTVSKATFLSNLAPVVVILFSYFFLKEKFTKFFYIAAGLSLGGMTLLLGESFQFNKEQFLGDLLGVLTAVWYGSYIITISQLRKKYNTTSIMFISGIITSIILIIISLIFEQQLIPQTINSIIVAVCDRGNMAPNNAMHTIHSPVPGMAEHGWHRKLAHIFSTLTEETALYRSNFGKQQQPT